MPLSIMFKNLEHLRVPTGESMNAQKQSSKPTVGSLFAGIGGFDIGFEAAGFTTAWQVEIHDICRAVLADRFPHAKQHIDVRTCLPDLSPVDVIVGGFPCQDVSTMGKRKGLAGERTGLFFDAIRIIQTLRPRYIVLENVAGLISSNHGEDFQTVIETLSQCGYLGIWRMLDSSYFGVPTRRRRVFMVGCLGNFPPLELMGDAGPMERILGKGKPCAPEQIPHNTLLAGIGSTIDLSASNVIAQANGWDKMVERTRKTEDYGFLRGLDETNAEEARAAGNAVCPQVAQWIAEKLIKTF